MSEFLEKGRKCLGLCSYGNCSESQFCVEIATSFVHDFLVRLEVGFEMPKIFVAFC